MDRDDIVRLYREYYPGIVGFFVKRGCSVEEARDLAQEVFVRVFKGMDTFRGASSEKTWIFTIARHVWLNALRDRNAQRRQGETVQLDESFEIPSSDPPADQQIMDAERSRMLWKAIAELPPRQRLCVRLRLLRDLKYREIAKIMGVSLDQVKALLHDAKKNLIRSCGEAVVPDFEESDEGRNIP